MERPLDQERREAMPPAGYRVVADVVNDREGEGDRVFACPEVGCDGFTFDSVNECHIHAKDWHSPPYSCSECDARFAAMPALKRHFKSAGHYNWICQEDGCEMKGVLFANRSEFLAHALRISGHERLLPAEDVKSPWFPKRINYAEVLRIPCDDDDDNDDDGVSEPLDEEEAAAYQCLEPACRRHGQFFHSEGEFGRHEESHAHVNAIGYSQHLRESGKAVADIAAEQEAARELRCTAQGCPFFGERLKTSQSFYKHISTAKHVYPLLNRASDPTSPTADIRQQLHQLNLACDEPECARYEHRFANYMNFTRHVQSILHLKAVSYGQMKRNTVTSDCAHEEPQPPDAVTVPSTPARWSSYSFAPMTPNTDTSTRFAEFPETLTPTRRSIRNTCPLTPPPPPPPASASPSSSWRKDSLVKKNEELEKEVRQLKDKIERLRSAYKEQISSLFQALGAEQARKSP